MEMQVITLKMYEDSSRIEYVNLIRYEKITNIGIPENKNKSTVSVVIEFSNKIRVKTIYIKKTINDIRKMISEDNKINLLGCYIDSFSTEDINIDSKYINIERFDARFSFWHNGANFSRINFGNAGFNLAFSNIDFGKVNFYETVFGFGDVSFDYTNFGNATVAFNSTIFGKGDINFYDATINTSIIFSNITFENDCDFRFHQLNTLKIINCKIKELMRISGHLKNLAFYESINLGRIDIDLLKSNCIVALKNTYLNALYKRDILDDNIFAEINVDLHDKLRPKEKYSLLSKDLHLLKENYHDLGYYESEDDTYFYYMRYYRKSLKGSFKNLFKKAFYFSFDYISGYGTRPWRILMVNLLSVISFGVLNSIIFINQLSCSLNTRILDLDIIELSHKVHMGFYLSTITFLTVGYGDVKPLNGLMRFLAGLEGFCGLFLMSLLTVTVVRKVLR